MFTVCVLLYGDYPALADRVLGSLARPAFAGKFQLRLGLNEVSPATDAIIQQKLQNIAAPCCIFRSATNRGKYPMMREMFYREPLETPWIMWFDDDSFIRPEAPDHWFDILQSRAETTGAAQMGSQYTIRLHPNQVSWIKKQPWYTGRPVPPRVSFCTGGWWVARTDVIRDLDYPFPELYHNGGDVMLSVALRQQGRTIVAFSSGVAINADDSGKESAAPRRGLSTKPIGWDSDE